MCDSVSARHKPLKVFKGVYNMEYGINLFYFKQTKNILSYPLNRYNVMRLNETKEVCQDCIKRSYHAYCLPLWETSMTLCV